MSKDSRNRIPSEELTAYERWELPLLDRDGNEVAHSRAENRDVKPLTAADIEAIREAAWEDGKAEGRDVGHQEGYDAGFDSGRHEGYEKGHGEGAEEGRRHGAEATRNDVTSGLERLEKVMGDLLDPIRRHEEELETALFNLTATLSRAVIFRELQIDSSQIREVVRHAMASLPSTRDNVRIRVNPVDVSWVQEVAGGFESEAIVAADENILPGGCQVETRYSLVDYTVEKRFQKAVQGMLDQQLDSGDSGDTAGLDAIMDDLTEFRRDVLEENAPPGPEDNQTASETAAAEPIDSASAVDHDTPDTAVAEAHCEPADPGPENGHTADPDDAQQSEEDKPENREEQNDRPTR